MSENLDLVRSFYAHWERGDFRQTSWADPEIEYVVPDGPEPSRGTGLASLAERSGHALTAWEHYRIEADKFRELDDGRVLVLAHVVARGKRSGVNVGQDVGQVRLNGAGLFEIRDGKVITLMSYNDAHRALADLGLEE